MFKKMVFVQNSRGNLGSFHGSLSDYIFSMVKKTKKIEQNQHSHEHIDDLVLGISQNNVLKKDVVELKEKDLMMGDYFLKSFVHEGFRPDLHDQDKFTNGDYILKSFITFEPKKIVRKN